MIHFALQALCFVLWVTALNFAFFAVISSCKRESGSALLFTAGMACLMLWLEIGLKAHIDIARIEPFAGITVPLAAVIAARRKAGKSNRQVLGKHL